MFERLRRILGMNEDATLSSSEAVGHELNAGLPSIDPDEEFLLTPIELDEEEADSVIEPFADLDEEASDIDLLGDDVSLFDESDDSFLLTPLEMDDGSEVLALDEDDDSAIILLGEYEEDEFDDEGSGVILLSDDELTLFDEGSDLELLGLSDDIELAEESDGELLLSPLDGEEDSEVISLNLSDDDELEMFPLQGEEAFFLEMEEEERNSRDNRRPT